MKDLSLTESKKLEFRAEFFNIFNHAQFGSPQGDVTNSSLVSSPLRETRALDNWR